MADLPEIIDGPAPIQVPREGETYRWKVMNGRAEQHVYVEIAGSLRAEAYEEPLRSAIESKGESVLRVLLSRNHVPTRIKITSAGISEVGSDLQRRIVTL
ncbi:MAG TPA: hypothetical protein VGN25_09655 [Solirubrobacteraceae bacterium]|nr:hypothetical protein [Solirubrobacteraceae bacterium]